MLETHLFNPVLDKEFILENYDTPEYLLEVWGDFLALMPEEIEELQQAQAAGDKDRLVKKIHASSSAIGFTGGIALCDRMKDFENKAKNDPGFDVKNEESVAIITEISDFITIIQKEYVSLS